MKPVDVTIKNDTGTVFKGTVAATSPYDVLELKISDSGVVYKSTYSDISEATSKVEVSTESPTVTNCDYTLPDGYLIPRSNQTWGIPYPTLTYTESELKIGDIVELNSGGPKMTVTKVRENSVSCYYFLVVDYFETDGVSIPSYKSDVHEAEFPKTALKK